ncbi:MAG TPA: glucosaminidase domain-containing protein [Stenomitos sp.]
MAVREAGAGSNGSYQSILTRLHQRVADEASAPAPQIPGDSFVRAGGGSYTVQSGDSLSKIAQRTLGNGNRWREIYDLNRDVLNNPNLIRPGQVLKLPGGSSPAPAPAAPAKPAAPAAVMTSLLNRFHDTVERFRAAKLGTITPEQLKALGEANKRAFFNALRPAAEAAERQYGVPAAVTLAQAALESGWGQHAIGGYNIFGIKGQGPAGTVSKSTQEWENGRYITIQANFAKYDNFNQAVLEHGKVFQKSYYDKAMQVYSRNKDPKQFAQNITGVYATDPSYGQKLISLMDSYNLA